MTILVSDVAVPGFDEVDEFPHLGGSEAGDGVAKLLQVHGVTGGKDLFAQGGVCCSKMFVVC